MLAELIVGFKSFENIMSWDKIEEVTVNCFLEIDRVWLFLVVFLSLLD